MHGEAPVYEILREAAKGQGGWGEEYRDATDSG